MDTSDLHYATLGSVCARMKSGELSAVQVTTAVLERIRALEGSLHAFACVLGDSALATAERLDRLRADGAPLGALHGVPVAVKDLLYTAGIPTASGTKVMADFIPDEDATVVARLKAAGAVVIGKTQLTEGAFGAHHPDIDPPRNPWNRDHWPGVSSSGSGVAVAAGLGFGALGTDTGGSIRFPSASCGVVGIKPTYGRVSRHGAFPLAESLDHIGPMTRTVADAARLLQVIAGADGKDPTALEDPVPNYAAALVDRLETAVVGVDWDYVTEGVDAVVVDTVREALGVLGDLGAEVKEVRLPAAYRVLVDEWGVTCAVECAKAHAAYYPAQKALYGPVLANLIELGLDPPKGEYARLEGIRRAFRADLERLLGTVDVLIAPCMPVLPPPVEVMNRNAATREGVADFITFTAPFDYSGHPTLTLPVGLSSDRLPRAVQIVGRLLAEPTLIRVGSALERALGFAEHPLP